MKIKQLWFISFLCFLSCQKEEGITTNNQGTNPVSTANQTVDQRLTTQLDATLQTLSTSDPLQWTDDDLQFLDKLADKKIVGLGEATHGTSEFFKAKHRIFQYLVEHHGFRVFAFEADFGESIFINEAIQDGRVGDIRGLMLDKMHFWTWKTEEVLDLLEWMATYNQGKAAADKIHYVGVDCQYNDMNVQWALDYFEEHDNLLYIEAKEILEDIAAKTIAYYDQNIVLDNQAYTDRIEDLTTLISKFNNRKEELIEGNSLKEYEFQERLLRIIEQTFQVAYGYKTEGFSTNYRDTYMAENTMWLPAHFEEAKIVVWGHNYHVSRTDNGPSMGKILSNNYGGNYHIIGFTFNTGSFTAVEYKDNQSNGLQQLSISSTPKPQSLNHFFSEAVADNFVVNLQELAQQTQWSSLFAIIGADFLSIGAVFNNTPEDYYRPFYSAHYHDMIHIETTTAAQQLR